jgi:hypothetical protein
MIGPLVASERRQSRRRLRLAGARQRRLAGTGSAVSGRVLVRAGLAPSTMNEFKGTADLREAPAAPERPCRRLRGDTQPGARGRKLHANEEPWCKRERRVRANGQRVRARAGDRGVYQGAPS